MAPALGLPRATFAKLSPHPYLLANLDPSSTSTTASTTHAPTRSNGRKQNEVRQPTVNRSSLTHAHGSAVVRMGDTTVICGVRGETILTSQIPNFRADNQDSELRDYDLLVPNIELATGAAPQFLPGGPPTSLAQTLSTRVYSLMHSSKLIRPHDLRIWHKPMPENLGERGDTDDEDEAMGDGDAAESMDQQVVIAYWVLYIDIFFISFDGNPFDAAWAATLAALQDTKLPQARYDPDRDMIICKRENPRLLDLTGMPIACTAVVFTGKETDRETDERYWLLVDPDMLEESLCDESVTIVVDRCKEKGMSIVSLSKNGGTRLSPELLQSKQFLGWAEERWKAFTKAIGEGNDAAA